MKKLFAAVLAVCFIATGAMAADFEWSGSYYVRGSYYNNHTVDKDSDYDPYGQYDQELDIAGKIVVNDQTFVRVHMEMHDESWIQSKGYSGPVTLDTSGDTAKFDQDDNIYFRKVWGGHQFQTGTLLEVGLMSGGAWATSFSDNGNDFYRVKATQALPIGSLIGVLQKNKENGSATEKAEENDSDSYILGLVTKAGGVNIKPLIAYTTNGANDLADDEYDTTTSFYLGVDGQFGMIGFESEFVYSSADLEESTTPGGEDSYSVYGFYGDVWFNFDPAKAGLYLAYGSVDDDAEVNFSFGDDFDGHGSELIGNEFAFGGTDAVGGATMFGVYGSFAPTDALSLWAQISYAKGNKDANIEDDTAYDISARVAYKITDAVTYKIGGGYAAIDLDEGSDPDPGYKIYHRFDIAF